MIKIRQTRSELGKSTAFMHQGRTVNENKLRRHLKEATRGEVARRAIFNEGFSDLRSLTGSSYQLGSSLYVSRPDDTRNGHRLMNDRL